MRLLTAVSGVRVPQQAPQSTLRVQWHARGQARRHAEPQWTRLRRRANNRYSVALLLTGVRVPQQAPESTRKRVLLFCFGLSPLRVQWHARGQARRHAEPQWTRLRPRERTIAIPSRCSLRGSSPVVGARKHPKTGAFVLFRALTPARATARARASPPTRGTAVDAIAPARANNRYSVALLLTGVRFPWQAPQSTRKRVLRVQWHARGQARRHAEPQWTRLRRRANNRYSVALLLTGVEQSCRRQRQNNEPKGKRLRHFTFKIISGVCACAGGDGAGEGGGTGHTPY